MTKLHDLYLEGGQSPWIDNLMRGWLADGHLAWLVGQGVRGVTSNPTIMAKAIEATGAYDEQFRAGLDGTTIEQGYWDLVLEDIRGALWVLSPLYEHSGGRDGFVSVEVSPSLAHDTEATVASALSLHERVGRPNLLVKIPATPEGVPAIRRVIGEGKSVNVTLIFSLERYGEVIDAYLSGLEDLVARGGDPAQVASVASFFVSRVDTEVDQRLEAVAAESNSREPLDLRGRAAVAQAKVAYELFRDRFRGPRWEALSAKGAWVQRPLWASTSTKNPDYPELLYVNDLIGPDTVSTMPDATLEAFLDHGEVRRTVRHGLEEARSILQELAEVGVDLEAVAEVLEDEGVAAFAKSFEECQEVLAAKAIGRQAG
ncbi:MAG: transaldolase [Acidimicrobiales bacterium]|nr:transaldolase [Acidimicrobiales bacterium]MBO0892808.1 transaldolase [Acidimicrobiales bacterium]